MLLFVMIFICFIAVICESSEKTEITVDDAVNIAKKLAITFNYDTSKTDIEVLKVKKGKERGPIRLVWLMRYLSKEELPTLIDNEFLIVYFYPKGLLDGRLSLGGGFCVLVELYSGDILFSFEDQ